MHNTHANPVRNKIDIYITISTYRNKTGKYLQWLKFKISGGHQFVCLCKIFQTRIRIYTIAIKEINSISQIRKHSLCMILLGISWFISSMSLWTLMLKLILIFLNELHLNIKGNLNDYALLQSVNCLVVLFYFIKSKKQITLKNI